MLNKKQKKKKSASCERERNTYENYTPHLPFSHIQSRVFFLVVFCSQTNRK